mmetsp:Transcript_27640/g.26663  ORF Transcript_27640/g.26663 Transcript_27640/m.26663 type:complete len:173 (-) Transcript_27640:415-933(-)
MGCFKDKSRLIELLLFLTFVGLILMGIFTLWFGKLLYQSAILLMTQYTNLAFYIGLSIGLFIMLFIPITIALMISKDRKLASVYGFFIFIFWLISLGAGGGFIWARANVPPLIEDGCGDYGSTLWIIGWAYVVADLYYCTDWCNCNANYLDFDDLNERQQPEFFTTIGTTHF